MPIPYICSFCGSLCGVDFESWPMPWGVVNDPISTCCGEPVINENSGKIINEEEFHHIEAERKFETAEDKAATFNELRNLQ